MTDHEQAQLKGTDVNRAQTSHSTHVAGDKTEAKVICYTADEPDHAPEVLQRWQTFPRHGLELPIQHQQARLVVQHPPNPPPIIPTALPALHRVLLTLLFL